MDERKSSKLKAQHVAVAAYLQGRLAESIPVAFVVLNCDREIVFANTHAIRFLGKESMEELLGVRPGEAVYCVHALEYGACGSAPSCEHCGNVQAVMGAGLSEMNTGESRVLTKQHGTLNALNIKVDAGRMVVDGEEFTIVYLQDVSKIKDREVLEQFFMHDALNALGGIMGAAGLICESACGIELELAHAMKERASQLVHDVHFLQSFFAAEQNELVVEPVEFSALGLLHELRVLCSAASCAEMKSIVVEDVPDVLIVSDKGLLQRSLENLVKNALEASREGDTVTLGYLLNPASIHFFIKSRPFIPRHIQVQLFQRTFSTKGRGRGIGMYSARLFVTNYLNGSISFESTIEEGTTFFVQIPRV